MLIYEVCSILRLVSEHFVKVKVVDFYKTDKNYLFI